MSLTSSEINYLIWRYLQESGFDLSAFAFDKQAKCQEYENEKSQASITRIEPGCLVNLIQKGILYTIVEKESSDGKIDKNWYSLLGSLLEEQIEKLNNEDESSATSNAKNNRFKLKSEVGSENDNMVMDEDIEKNTENDEDLSLNKDFTTKVLVQSLNFHESLTVLWHPSIDAYAYGREDATAVINVILEGKIGESVVLKHPISSVGPSSDSNEIICVSWSPDGTSIITAGFNGELRHWSPNGKLRNIAHPALMNTTTSSDISNKIPVPIHKIIWGFSDAFFLTIDMKNTVCLWDAAMLSPIQVITNNNQSSTICDVAWIDDAKFAVPQSDNSIKIYSISPSGGTQEFSSSSSNAYVIKTIGSLRGHYNAISALEYDSKKKLLASASDFDYTIKIWQSGSSQELISLKAQAKEYKHDVVFHKAPILCLAWLDNVNDLILSVSMEGVLNIWNIGTGDPELSTNIFYNTRNYKFEDKVNIIDNSKHQNLMAFAVKVSPSLKLVAVADNQARVMIYDIDIDSYKKSSTMIDCIGYYDFDAPPDSKGESIGICDLSWNKNSDKLCISYKGSQSVMVEIGEL